MGLTASWVAVSRGAGASLAFTAFASVDVVPLSSSEDWIWGRPRLWGAESLGHIVSRAAEDTDGPAHGGWVADSDCALLFFASPGGAVAACVPINETAPFGEPLPDLCHEWADLERRRQAFEDLASWSREHGPQILRAADLLREMPGGEDAGPPPDVFDYGGAGPWFHEDDQHGWVFAEDGVRLIYRRLGIDSPDEFVFQHA